MDITCPRCSEPWDMDTLHDAIEAKYPDKPWTGKPAPKGARLGDTAYSPYYEAMSREFRAKGCGVAFADFMGQPPTPCSRVDDDRTQAARVLYDLLGDDLDGAAAMLEDLAL